MGRVRSPKRRVRDDDFMLGCPRNVLGMSSNRLYIGGSNSGISRWNLELRISWQGQYLVSLKGDFTCSAHWKWRFICDADHWWHWFCVAGAVFGEVGVWLFVAGAAFRAILGDSRSAKCCIFSYKMRFQDGTSQVSEAAGARWRFHARMSSECPRNVLESSLYWRKQFRDFSLKSWTQNFVAGAVFGEVGGWLCLLCALEMTFHMRRGSIMRCILRGRRSIWWSWSVTFRGRRSIWWHFGR